MKNLRYLLRLFIAYLISFKAYILIGVIAGIILFLLANYVYPRINFNGTEKIGVLGRFHPDELPDFILRDIGKGLTLVDPQGNIVPDMAKSWETIDKGKTWIFIINKNLTWQDGSPITSSDISFDFSDVEIERPDDETLIFKLKEEYIPFPSVVSKPLFKKGLLGAGVWKVKTLSVNGSFVQEILTQGPDKRKRQYKFYPTLDRLLLAYKMGKIDKIANLLEFKTFDNWNTSLMEEFTNKKQVVTLFFNSNDKLLSEKNVRQALNYSLDKEKMGERAFGPITPGTWAYNPQVKKYSFDKERAKELVEELSPELKESLNVSLVTTPLLLTTAEEISRSWKDVGITSNILVTSIIPKDFQAFLTILDVPDDPDQYSLWHSTQTLANISNYKNVRIDKLLEDGRKTINLEERKKIYFDFQRFLLEDVPAAFLYHPKYYTISRK